VQDCVKEIDARVLPEAIKIKIETVSLSFEAGQGIKTSFEGMGHEKFVDKFTIPNILEHLSEETHLTYRTLVKILTRVKNPGQRDSIRGDRREIYGRPFQGQR
jgi:hypothetical protein